MSGTRAHVLWVVPRLLIPAQSGGELRILDLLRRLKGRYALSLLIPVARGLEAKHKAGAARLEGELGGKVHLVPELGSERPRSRWLPRSVQAFQNPALRERLRRVVIDEKVDIVQLEFREMAQFRGAAGSARVLATEHDAASLRWTRSYEREGASPSLRAARWLRSWLYEWWALRRCDLVVSVSERDADVVGRVFPRRRIRVVPTGVDLERFAFRPFEARTPGQALFVGHYPHAPNEDAAVHLCREIWPLVRQRLSGARLELVGSEPSRRLRALASPTVSVTGAVADVRPHLARARAFLAPIRLGAGIKGKLLEAFAAGAPVVASEEACEGLPGARDGTHLLVGRGPEDFARKAALALSDAGLGGSLAAEARAYAEREWGCDLQAERMHAVYQEALALR